LPLLRWQAQHRKPAFAGFFSPAICGFAIMPIPGNLRLVRKAGIKKDKEQKIIYTLS